MTLAVAPGAPARSLLMREGPEIDTITLSVEDDVAGRMWTYAFVPEEHDHGH